MRSNEGYVPCPNWCVEHMEIDRGSPDHAVIHRGAEQREVEYFSVELVRMDLLRRGLPGPVSVRLGDTELTPKQATALAGLLATAASSGDEDEATIVRTMELPEGEDYVVFADCNVVGVSSRLDEAGRNRALSNAGVR